MDNLINFLPALFFILLLIYNIKKLGRVASLSSFIIALYAISMLSYGIYCFSDSTYFFNTETIFIVFISILILTRPLASFEKKITAETKIIEIEKKKYNVLVVVVVILSLYSILFFTKNISQVFNSDFTTIRNDLMTEGGGFYESSMFSKIAVFGAYLSPIALFLYFYTLIVKENKNLGKLLLLSSTSFIFYTMNVAARDGAVIWIFTYIALIGLFYPLLSKKIIANQKKIILISIALVTPYFLLITIGRFGDGNGLDKDVIYSMFNYIGQQPYELSDRINKLNVTQYAGEPRLVYPLLVNIQDIFSGIVKGPEMINRFDLRSDSIDLDLNTYRFVYYIGDILTELGLLGLIIFTTILYSIYRINLKIIDNNICFSTLLISFSWYMIIIVGVFYFYYGQLIGNVFLVIPFLIHLYLNQKTK